MFLWMWFDQRLKSQTEGLLTGAASGRPLGIGDHHLTLLSWIIAVASAIGFQTIFTFAYWTLSRNAATDEARAFAQLYAFFSATGVVAHVVFASVGLVRFRRLFFYGDTP